MSIGKSRHLSTERKGHAPQQITVVGCKPVPVIKLASNSPMFNRMAQDMDINCSVIADGTNSVEEMGAIIFQKILDTASGKKTKSAAFGFGSNEFVPWQIGAVL